VARKPEELKPDDFLHYGDEGRRVAIEYLGVLRQMPLSLLVAFLRELRSFDYKFPQEQQKVHFQLAYLTSCAETDRSAAFQPFAEIPVSSKLQEMDWLNDPQSFSQDYAAALWAMGKMNQYRLAATALVANLAANQPGTKLPAQRVVIVSVGRDATGAGLPLFRKLHPYGVRVTNLRPDGARSALLDFVTERARKYPAPYAHWYIDGGSPWPLPNNDRESITEVSYPALGTVRQRVLEFMSASTRRDSGPEMLERRLEHIDPRDLALDQVTRDPKMQYFCAGIFTEGSGTQIFSTTFVQWTACEALERAQPLTMLARFAPRQKQRPMNELLRRSTELETDPEGSLVDGEMGAFYTFLQMRKLPESSRAVFLAWFEGHSESVLVCPTMPAGSDSQTSVSMQALLQMALD
jgi:hypothetical protein